MAIFRAKHTTTRFDKHRNEAFVLNKETGKVVVMSGKDLDLWRRLDDYDVNTDVNSDDSHLINKFSKAKLISDGAPTGNMFVSSFDSSFVVPAKFFIDLTYDCNMKCRHCHNDYGNKYSTPIENIEGALDELSDLKTLYISFGGGEPFIREDILDIFEYMDNKGIAWTTPTNATIITEEQIKAISKFDNLHCLAVSLDGRRETHNRQRRNNTYGKVIDNIHLMREYEIPVKINTVATSITVDDIPKMHPIVKDLGAKYWKIIRYIPEIYDQSLIITKDEENRLLNYIYGLSDDELPYLDEMSFDKNCTCMLGKICASIDAHGDMSPCGFIPQLKSGNAYETSIEDVLRNGFGFALFRNAELKYCPAYKMRVPDSNIKSAVETFLEYS